MRYDVSKYDRFIDFQVNSAMVNTKGSRAETWTSVFTGYAGKISNSSGNDTSLQSGARTTEESATWVFPYNTAITAGGRFSVDGDTSRYYYVVGYNENLRKSEILVQAEVKR